MEYLKRIADRILQDNLEASGAVLVEGPKWCGKTTTCSQIANSSISLQDVDMRDEYLATAASKPSLLLMGDTPRLIDEWQLTPKLWGVIRFEVDHRGEMIPFILMGAGIMPIAETTGYMWSRRLFKKLIADS